MGMIKYALVGNYKRFYEKIKQIAKKEHKNSLLLTFDMALSTILYGSGLTDYINYEFYNKSHKQKKEYVTIGYATKYHKIVAPIEESKVFDVKTEFLKKFKKYINRDFYLVEDGLENLKTFLKNNSIFMEKPIVGCAGGGVLKKESKDIKNIEKYYNYLKDKKLFLDEFLVQHEKLSALAPASVNTLRIMTSSANGKSRIIYSAIRIGNGINYRDNFHQGGMSTLIDVKTGKLVGTAFDKDRKEYINHPVTNIKFDGYQLPFWEETKKLCLEAALVVDGVHEIGWDVAITEDGPTFIEGNPGPGYDLPQILEKRGLKDLTKSVLKDMKNGFTLIELVAIIAILGILATISMPIVTNAIKESRVKSYNNQVSIIKEAAKNYVLEYSETLTLPDGDENAPICIDLDTLKEAGVIKNETIKNPKDDTIMNGSITVSYNEDYSNYDYTYNDNGC